MKLHVPVDSVGLPVLGTELVDGKTVQFSWPIGQDRLRLVLCGAQPPVIGSVIGLDGPEPKLVASEPANAQWAATQAAPLVAAAAALWRRTFGDGERRAEA